MNDSVENGLVLVSYGGRGVAETAGGAHVDCAYRRSVGRPVCGDHVEITETGTGTGVVSTTLKGADGSP